MNNSMWFKRKLTKEEAEKKFNKIKSAFSKIKAEQKQFLEKQDEANKRIEENSQEIKKHSEKIISLEALVSRPIEPTKRLNPTKRPTKPSRLVEDLDLDDFSEQEKRILNTLLTHKNMALSYEDLAKSLNKSPNTIKNQLNKIRAKSDILEISYGERNRFKLKTDLKISKSL
jgi:DNA-binding CsgD family transcriptional regulator